jgi:hypothetical protein
MKPEGSGGRLSRQESSRRGVDLRDPQHAVGMTRQDSIKPPSSSRNREKDADISRSSSQVGIFPHVNKMFTNVLFKENPRSRPIEEIRER